MARLEGEPWVSPEEWEIRRRAVLEALKTRPPTAASMWARAVLIAGKLRGDG